MIEGPAPAGPFVSPPGRAERAAWPHISAGAASQQRRIRVRT